MQALEPVIVAATRAAALACQPWLGRGQPAEADAAATEAMRAALANAAGTGTVVIGEGEKDSAPMLYNGERVGNGLGQAFDIAVDPLECTDNCADGLPGALATIAVGEAGSLWSPGPGFYMDKLVVAPAASEAIDLRESPESNLESVAGALGRPISHLRVVVLDKPRHGELIERMRSAGASVSTPSAGDVAASLEVLLPGGESDLLMGIGGTPEGVMSATAVQALGGGMQARLAPQSGSERARLAAVGFEVDRVLALEDLVSGDSFFVACGVSGGRLLRRPWRSDGATLTESIVVSKGSVRRIVEASFEDGQ